MYCELKQSLLEYNLGTQLFRWYFSEFGIIFRLSYGVCLRSIAHSNRIFFVKNITLNFSKPSGFFTYHQV